MTIQDVATLFGVLLGSGGLFALIGTLVKELGAVRKELREDNAKHETRIYALEKRLLSTERKIGFSYNMMFAMLSKLQIIKARMGDGHVEHPELTELEEDMSKVLAHLKETSEAEEEAPTSPEKISEASGG